MRMIPMIAVILLAIPARAAEKDLPAYRPPVEDEAHGLKGSERETALHVLDSHYRNWLETFGPIRLPGRDRKDFSKPAVCEVKVSIDPQDFRPGSFADGLPVRRAQPIVFNSFQQQLVEGQLKCEDKILFTKETWREIEDRSLQLLIENSGTTYCRADSDCYGAEIVADPCGARRRVRVFGSNTTDAVFFIAFRKFMPPLLHNVWTQFQGAVLQYGEKHPDHGIALKMDACPLKHWEETPIDAVCIEHSCRPAGEK